MVLIYIVLFLFYFIPGTGRGEKGAKIKMTRPLQLVDGAARTSSEYRPADSMHETDRPLRVHNMLSLPGAKF